MAEIIPMTEEQKFQLEIYKLVMNQNAAAEEAFQFIGTDELKLELFKIHFQSGGANSDITTRTIEAVRKAPRSLICCNATASWLLGEKSFRPSCLR